MTGNIYHLHQSLITVVLRGKGEKGTASEFKPCACEYAFRREANTSLVIVDCKETGGPAALTARECRARAMEILAQEVNVDSLILSQYRETQYTAPAMELLHRLRRIGSEFHQLSLRNPHKTYFEPRTDLSAKEKKDQLKLCEECPWNPTTYFDRLAKDETVQDPGPFYEEFVREAERLLGATKPEVCNPCLAASRGEMEYMAQELLKLRAFVLYEGFRVVEPGGAT